MGSKSKSSSATTYQNTDKRAIADNGALAITGDGTSLSSNVQNTLALSDSRSWQNNDSRSWQNNDSRSWADNSVTTINTIDAGAVKASADVVRAALETVQKADATAGQGFESTIRLATDSFGRLVDLAGDVLGGGATALERSQELTAQAYRESVETRQATIDNKTISTIAIAAAVGFVGYGMMKK